MGRITSAAGRDFFAPTEESRARALAQDGCALGRLVSWKQRQVTSTQAGQILSAVADKTVIAAGRLKELSRQRWRCR